MPIPSDLEQALKSELRDGETLLWHGLPQPGKLVRESYEFELAQATLFLSFVFSCLFGTCFLWGHPSALHLEDKLLIFLLTVPEILLSFALPYLAYHRALRTIYAVTNLRAMVIISDGAKRLVESYVGFYSGEVDTKQDKAGLGSVTFRRSPSDKRIRSSVKGFFAINSPREVAALIEGL